MSACSALDGAKKIAQELHQQAAEEVAALVDFLESTHRSQVQFSIPPDAGWTYEYEANHHSGFGKRRGVGRVRFARLVRANRLLFIAAGPTEDYATAVECKYGELRDRMGGFQALVDAITAELQSQLQRNSSGRDDALSSLAAVDGGAA